MTAALGLNAIKPDAAEAYDVENVLMGRPRKHDPTIPEHIDQAKLPADIYWGGTRNVAGMYRRIIPKAALTRKQ